MIAAVDWYALATASLWAGLLFALAFPTLLYVAEATRVRRDRRRFDAEREQARAEGAARRDLDRHADQAIAIASSTREAS